MKALASRSHKNCLLHGARQLFHVCCISSLEIWLFDQTSHKRSRTRKEVIENCPVKRSEIKAVKYKAARLFTVLYKYYLEVPWQKVDIERETYKIRFRQENTALRSDFQESVLTKDVLTLLNIKLNSLEMKPSHQTWKFAKSYSKENQLCKIPLHL